MPQTYVRRAGAPTPDPAEVFSLGPDSRENTSAAVEIQRRAHLPRRLDRSRIIGGDHFPPRLCAGRAVTALQYTAADRARWHAGLAWIARERGYQPGWVAHKFKEKFGAWPKARYVVPSPPSDEMRSWVRSRDIAYAKAKQAAG